MLDISYGTRASAGSVAAGGVFGGAYSVLSGSQCCAAAAVHHRQTQLWQLVSDIAKQSPNSLSMSLADACNQLYTSQQETMASWRQQIPMAAWLMVMVFGVFSNFLIGYHMPAGSWGWLLIVPFVTALALFMIAEIDVPGKGVIHVTPQNLQALRTVISGQGLIP